MDAFSIAQLLANQDPASPVKLRYGTVTALNANGTLSVIPDGQTQAVSVIKCCRPKVGSRVVVLVNDTEWLAVSVIGGDQIGTDGLIDGAVTPAKLALNYSAVEQKTGKKWIDGRPIYQKVVAVGDVFATTKIVAHGITNIARFTSVTGLTVNGGYYFNLTYINPSLSGSSGGITANETGITVITGSGLYAYDVFAILEYTKSTD